MPYLTGFGDSNRVSGSSPEGGAKSQSHLGLSYLIPYQLPLILTKLHTVMVIEKILFKLCYYG